jgi:hypothetical protein
MLTGKSTGISDVTNCSSLYNVTNNKFLDGLILGDTTGTVSATNSTNVATAMLGASTVAAFACLKERKKCLEPSHDRPNKRG